MTSEAAVAAVDRFSRRLLNYEPDLDQVIADADAHPGCALLQVYAALLFIFSQNEAVIAEKARPFLARARACAANERERGMTEAAEAWANASFARAKALLDGLTSSYPADLVALKIAEFLYFQEPDARRHSALMERAASANQGVPEFLAMQSFAAELTGDRQRAKGIAEEAISRQESTPWAHHALAHALINEGDVDRGVAIVARHAASWSGHDVGMQTHLWWHAALFHLAALECDQVRSIYLERVWAHRPDDVFTHTDAVSLLWRVELIGKCWDGAWAPMMSHLSGGARGFMFPFLASHYAYALARGGQEKEARDVIARQRRLAEQRQGEEGRIWQQIGTPLVEGCLAAAIGDHAAAARVMEPAIREAQRIGGSDAQNDVIRQTWIVALAKSGRRDEAAAEAARRAGGRRLTPQEEAWLA
ncbi:MAG: hypothetical protein AB7M05_05035 [Alphaproteobacteria bacterium]